MLYIKIDENGNPLEERGISENQLKKIAKEKNVSLPEFSLYWNNDLLKEALGYAELRPPRADENLKQTSSLKFAYSIIKHPEGVYFRKLMLEPVSEKEAKDRWGRKRSDVIDTARKKLFASDYTQTLDHQLMKSEWAEYRKKLRDILADETTDPYLVEFPKVPKIVDTGDKLANKKEMKRIKLKAKTKERLNSRPRISTSLGFDVDGSTEDLMMFENAQKMGLTELKDADNQMQEIEAEDWDIILNAIRINGYNILKHKWDTEKLIQDAATVEELDAIEL
jgi:hypothetical protein